MRVPPAHVEANRPTLAATGLEIPHDFPEPSTSARQSTVQAGPTAPAEAAAWRSLNVKSYGINAMP